MSENTSYTINLVPVSSGTDTTGETDENYDSDIFLNLEQIDIDGEESYVGCTGDCESSLASTTTTAAASITSYTACLSECQQYCDTTQNVQIKVTKGPSDLNYSMSATYGTLGQKTKEHDNYAESHNINLDSELQISRDLDSVSGSWEGDVWDQSGNKIFRKPSIVYDQDTQTFTWGGATVVGTIRVTAIENYDVWTLTIPPRTDSATDSQWSSTIRAFYINGSTPQLETLSISEKSEVSECGTGGSILIVDPDDDDEKCWKAVYEVDPCTGEETRLADEQVSCPDTDTEDDDG